MVGPLVWSIVVVVAALVVLGILGLGLARAVGRTTTVLGSFTALLADRGGMIRARAAALQVRLARRRSPDPPAVGWGPDNGGGLR